MRERAILVIVFAVLLMGTTFVTLHPIKAAYVGQINIGICGPVGLPHWSPAGMKDAAEMAVEEINAAGGVHLTDGDYELVLKFGDEHAYPTPDPGAAAAEVERLITVEGCQFIIGGFRTECTSTMIEMAMDYDTPFFICGSSTNELISDTVPVDYERYKWLFRATPVNGSMLVGTIAGMIQYYLPTKLLPLFGHDYGEGPKVKVAVLTEDLMWSQQIHFIFTNPAYYPAYLGPYANVTYSARIPDGTTDCTSYLQGVIDSEARVMIHIFSGVTGVPLIMQWSAMNVSAIPLGINVMAQLQGHWATTSEACKYETILNFMGTRTPVIPGRTEVFWDKFVARTGGAWPCYTANGAYDMVRVLADALEAIGTTDKADLVTFLESYVDPTPTGSKQAKFDSTHDRYENEYGPFWTEGWSRSMIIQWQGAESMEVVSPVDQAYSKKWAIPPRMYPLVTDVNYDGKVRVDDVLAAALAFGTEPGHPRWEMEADINYDGKIRVDDILAIALDFGEEISLPLP